MSAKWRTSRALTGLAMALIASCTVFLFTRNTFAQSEQLSQSQREMILAEAQKTYDQGVSLRRDDVAAAEKAFGEAAARFEQLVNDGVVNGSLQFNLANAHLQAGDLGPAILHYRAAESLLRGDAALQHNLEYARSLRMNQIEPQGGAALWNALLTWHHKTSVRTRAAIFIISYLLFWTTLFLAVTRSAPAGKWIAIAACAIALATGASVAWDLYISDPGRAGVILQDNVTVRKGDGEGYEPQFREPLHEGVEFVLLEERLSVPGVPGWWQIELPDGNTGWIRSDQAGLVRDVLTGRAHES